MRLIAHRGFAGEQPENTLRAVRAAVDRADEIEVDVRRCDTGELVVIHDACVDRVTDGSGAVCRHSLPELRALDVLGTGEGVPTLQEVFEAVPPTVGVNVELKDVGLARDVLRLAREVDPQVIVSSFHANELEGCRGADESVPRAYLFDDDTESAMRFARDLDCCFVHPSLDCCDEQLVREAHAAGMHVNVWTIDRRSDAKRLAEFGVDGVIADCADVLPRAEL
jgi:glycerophosphoryl diester phosphodiesterase